MVKPFVDHGSADDACSMKDALNSRFVKILIYNIGLIVHC